MADVKCPFCKNVFNPYNLSHDTVRSLLKDKSEPVRALLTKVINKRRTVDAITTGEIHSFLSRVSGCSDRAIEIICDMYYDKYIEDPERGLGFLASMIVNKDKNLPRHADVERRIYGIPPKVKELDE